MMGNYDDSVFSKNQYKMMPAEIQLHACTNKGKGDIKKNYVIKCLFQKYHPIIEELDPFFFFQRKCVD